MSEPKIGYVLKVYPRFSETFIVTELISREAQGERAEIFALRPTTDERFHPALGRVQAHEKDAWLAIHHVGGDLLTLPDLLDHCCPDEIRLHLEQLLGQSDQHLDGEAAVTFIGRGLKGKGDTRP